MTTQEERDRATCNVCYGRGYFPSVLGDVNCPHCVVVQRAEYDRLRDEHAILKALVATISSPLFISLRNDGDGCPVGEQYTATFIMNDEGDEQEFCGASAAEAIESAHRSILEWWRRIFRRKR